MNKISDGKDLNKLQSNAAGLSGVVMMDAFDWQVIGAANNSTSKEGLYLSIIV